ncbi:Lipoyltransferase and lipoate-protein ligase [Pluteus cervinus]|uniref:Lipoyltransferase and lipoate-protein ligase n=1 Tax=Pluteus cervinus TaxID=181527 RepID=A0ACD3AL48_9AGAR|nr:Lipoyltransferase and lipoate-protein ligase [Pluteus cervinus]
MLRAASWSLSTRFWALDSHKPVVRRLISTITPEHSIYVSESHNPYFNLTFEDWLVLFRQKSPEKPLLLVYRDEPCVVIGRNQNPWKEVNLTALRTRPGVPFIRRRSGGGTVYHDLGNTNFSIHLPRTSFDRRATTQVILRAVRSLGVDAHVNDRNDICVGPHKILAFSSLLGLPSIVYVSGSAYKIVNKRAYHHGTMLISTQLDTLGDLLRTSKDTMVTRGVASVRSPVCNLQQHNPNVTHETFTQSVIRAFQEEYQVNTQPCTITESEGLLNLDYIKKGMLELPTWGWGYGQTPEFTYTLETNFSWGNVIAEIKARHGIIQTCGLQIASNSLDKSSTEDLVNQIEHKLVNQRYGEIEGQDSNLGPQSEVMQWLSRMMTS